MAVAAVARSAMVVSALVVRAMAARALVVPAVAVAVAGVAGIRLLLHLTCSSHGISDNHWMRTRHGMPGGMPAVGGAEYTP
ncbi:hypothetical protein BAU07_23980 [Bordetella flabilis]|uniref:Uncharacterized protein n=1 Tax=Bordetella flabilis TaxID=463014 RepID=A0A193GKI1_9BORD|nr:hypothetical protein BAU07_23980 [Bordetella flabilis]